MGQKLIIAQEPYLFFYACMQKEQDGIMNLNSASSCKILPLLFDLILIVPQHPFIVTYLIMKTQEAKNKLSKIVSTTLPTLKNEKGKKEEKNNCDTSMVCTRIIIWRGVHHLSTRRTLLWMFPLVTISFMGSTIHLPSTMNLICTIGSQVSETPSNYSTVILLYSFQPENTNMHWLA